MSPLLQERSLEEVSDRSGEDKVAAGWVGDPNHETKQKGHQGLPSRSKSFDLFKEAGIERKDSRIS
ncbi:unnamed protein product [Musa hybrid cultivar]